MSTPHASPLPAPGRLWAIIFSAGLIIAVTIGLRQSAGLYIVPVTKGLGTGLAPFSTSMALANLLWGATGILFGAIADRYGAGRVTALGIGLMMLGYYVMYAARSGGDLLWSGVAIGVGVGACGMTIMTGVIGRAAPPERRTQALATMGMASGLGNFIAFPYTHLLMETLGWQQSLLAIVATLACLLPCAWLISGKPGTVPGVKPQTLREAFREAMRLPSYWLLIAGFFVCGFHVAFYAVHLPAYVADRGLPAWVAVWALTAVGVANIIGTYLSGQSAKYIEKRRGLSLIYFARCFVFLALLFLPVDGPTIIVLSALLGFFWLATVPLTSGLVATFFGTNWLSMLFGFVFLSHQLGSFLGVWMAGVLFDATKSYDVMWWISIGLGLFAALIHWPIVERPVARLATERSA
ncbi:MAG: MFS transporter [Hyphomicrobiaceae bacterium]|nr:MFS transporter [Hyphomicrobiaceae bacterium]